MKSALVIVEQAERLDPFSRTVVARLIDEGRQITFADDALSRETITGRGCAAAASSWSPLPPSRCGRFCRAFRNATRITLARELEQFCASDAYESYLRFGTVPVFVGLTIPQPRSVSRLGHFWARSRSSDVRWIWSLPRVSFRAIGALVSPVELGRPGVGVISNGRFIFESDEICRQLQRHLSHEMIESLVDLRARADRR